MVERLSIIFLAYVFSQNKSFVSLLMIYWMDLQEALDFLFAFHSHKMCGVIRLLVIPCNAVAMSFAIF